MADLDPALTAIPTLAPDGFGPLKSFLLTPDGSFILPAQLLLAYAFAYALGYTLNFRFAAAFPLGHSFVISVASFYLLIIYFFLL